MTTWSARVVYCEDTDTYSLCEVLHDKSIGYWGFSRVNLKNYERLEELKDYTKLLVNALEDPVLFKAELLGNNKKMQEKWEEDAKGKTYTYEEVKKRLGL
jgi:hypothetical protein